MAVLSDSRRTVQRWRPSLNGNKMFNISEKPDDNRDTLRYFYDSGINADKDQETCANDVDNGVMRMYSCVESSCENELHGDSSDNVIMFLWIIGIHISDLKNDILSVINYLVD